MPTPPTLFNTQICEGWVNISSPIATIALKPEGMSALLTLLVC